jgi:hypothetical protein
MIPTSQNMLINYTKIDLQNISTSPKIFIKVHPFVKGVKPYYCYYYHHYHIVATGRV